MHQVTVSRPRERAVVAQHLVVGTRDGDARTLKEVLVPALALPPGAAARLLRLGAGGVLAVHHGDDVWGKVDVLL